MIKDYPFLQVLKHLKSINFILTFGGWYFRKMIDSYAGHKRLRKNLNTLTFPPQHIHILLGGLENVEIQGSCNDLEP